MYFPNVEVQIEYYLEYLEELRNQCEVKEIQFEFSDQILYQLDKKENKSLKIKI